ncbi:MAG: zinc/manganese transport system substrate-binding [Planctomycetota bacterium]|nr:MAG: zinc/manganese transport system substrate-binding [Planctomycetota bacterium]
MKRLFISLAAVGIFAVILHFGLALLGPSRPSGKPVVACTNAILADFVRTVAGPHVDVRTLIAPLGDLHKDPTSPELKEAVRGSWAIFENGLGLEPWLDDLVKSAPGVHDRYVATKGVSPLMRPDGSPDPHAWLDTQNVIKYYVENARIMLISIDPDHAVDFNTNADSLIELIRRAEAYITSEVESLAVQRRRILVPHDSTRYFAARFGFQTAAIAPAGITPGTADIEAASIWLMKERTPAMFTEAGRDEEPMRRLSSKNGRNVVGPLWTETLDVPGNPAGTYVGAMRENIALLAQGLR